jgi:hypothetical protein
MYPVKYGLDGQDLIHDRAKGFFFAPQGLDR